MNIVLLLIGGVAALWALERRNQIALLVFGAAVILLMLGQGAVWPAITQLITLGVVIYLYRQKLAGEKVPTDYSRREWLTTIVAGIFIIVFLLVMSGLFKGLPLVVRPSEAFRFSDLLLGLVVVVVAIVGWWSIGEGEH